MEGEVVDRVGGVLLLLPLAKSAHQGVIGVADLLVDEWDPVNVLYHLEHVAYRGTVGQDQSPSTQKTPCTLSLTRSPFAETGYPGAADRIRTYARSRTRR
jgi:hypothetical protein